MATPRTASGRRWSLPLILGGVLGLSTLGGTAALFLYNYQLLSTTATDEFTREQELAIEQIGDRIMAPLAAKDMSGVEKVINGSKTDGKGRLALGVLDAAGQLQAASPSKDYLDQIFKEAKADHALGELHSYKDGRWLVLQVPVESRRWDEKGEEQVLALGQLVGVFSPDEVEKALHRTFFQSLLILLAICFVAVGATYIVLGRLVLKPIQDLVRTAGIVAEGRLDIQIESHGADATNELSALQAAIQRMTDMMASFVRTVQPTAEQVGASSKTLTEITRQSSTNINQAVQVMTQISQSMAQVAQGTQNMASSIQQAGLNAQEGGKLAVKVVEKMKQSQESVAAAAGFIHGLGKRSSQIGNIVDLITKIADQTNLLSLNAAIEAARAGESGRGFAVVAEEIRKLAESSADSTQQITKLIREVQDETARAIHTTEKGNQEVAEGFRMTLEAEKLFTIISKEVAQVNAQVSSMAANTEQVAASTEEATASSEELSAAIEQVSGSAGDLASVVDKLSGLVRQFKTG